METAKEENVLINSSIKHAVVFGSKNMRNHLATMTTKKQGDPIIACHYGISLRMSCVQILQGPRSVNEDIINFYLTYLEKFKFKSANDMAFVPMETTQCMLDTDASNIKPLYDAIQLDLKQFLYFIFADNDGHIGNKQQNNNLKKNELHFTLVVYSRPEQVFYFYDSCNGNHKDATERTSKFIKELSIIAGCKRLELKSLRGKNLIHSTHDCGIRVLSMIEHVAEHVNNFECINGIGPLHQNKVSAMRTEILKIIHATADKFYKNGK